MSAAGHLASPARRVYKPALFWKLCRSVRRRPVPGLPLKGRAMKKEGHPGYHFINVVLNDGTSYKTRSTWGQPGATLRLDIDPTTHPAWTGGNQQMMDRGGRVTRFKKKFEGLV